MPDQPDSNATRNFALVFFINLVFTIIEIAGGYFTNSISIWADALHDFGDTLTLGIAWKLESVSKKKRDHRFSFGYRRFSLLGALVNGTVLFAGTLYILFLAIPRLFNPQEVNSEGMFALAILGILVNGFAAYKLKNKKSISESILSLHVLEDVLGWVAVLLVSIAIYFGDYYILDPILSICLALFIIFNSIGRIKKTLMVFLQSIPDEIDINALEDSLTQMNHVKNVHDTHLWSLDGEYHIITTHIVVAQDTPLQEMVDVKCEAREKLKLLDIEHATIEIEYEGEVCGAPGC